MDITSEAGRRAWEAVVADPGTTLLCTDFDGVLSPITSDPEAAYASEDAMDALGRLGTKLGKIAIVTGRMARTAVRLGRLQHRPGLDNLSVLGLYGNERWDAASREYAEPPAAPAVAAARVELSALLDRLGLGAAAVEDKRLSLVVHTRRLADPTGALARLRRPLQDLAARHGLGFEPGKLVLELRAPGRDKGDTIRGLVEEEHPRVVVFAGDDLGDIPAFDAVRDLRDAGSVEGLLICAASKEENALVELADIVVNGPVGVADLFGSLARRLRA